MTETYLAIGEVARASGLTVSALRYYDQEEVFVPAIVDATTGYRRYAVAQLPAVRLLAGMPRDRLAVSSASGRVLDPEDPVTSAADDAVPRAVGQRNVSVTAPVARVDEVARRAADGRMLTLHLAPSEIRCTSEEGDDVVAVPLTDDYPDHRRLLDDRDLGTGVDATALAALVRGAHGGGAGPADPGGEGPGGEGLAGEGPGGAAAGAGGFRRHTDAEGAPVVLVTASEDRLSVGSTQGAGSVTVGREFLLQALDAAGESPTLRLDGPISPLVIRRDEPDLLAPDANPHRVSVLVHRCRGCGHLEDRHAARERGYQSCRCCNDGSPDLDPEPELQPTFTVPGRRPEPLWPPGSTRNPERSKKRRTSPKSSSSVLPFGARSQGRPTEGATDAQGLGRT